MENTFEDYRRAYKEHLDFYGLEDDSESGLTDIDIFNYVIEHMSAEDRNIYGLSPIHYCVLRQDETVKNITGTDIDIDVLYLPYKGSAETFRIIYNGQEYDEFSTAFDFYKL